MFLPSALSSLGLSLGLGVMLAFGPMTAPRAMAEAVVGQGAAQGLAVQAQVRALTQTMRLGDIMAIMREEGLDYGRTLADEMFPGKGGPQWDAIVGVIYDADQMRSRFDTALSEALSDAGTDLAGMEAFFGSEQGQRVLKLEIEARRAMLDQAVEDAAKLAWEDMKAEGGPRVDRLLRFAEVNDLIESNVMGAMNANLAFYRGLAESGAFPQEMTQEQMLADVWGQEADVRAETEEWLFPYLSLAYQPLEDNDMDAYLAFSESPAGVRLNAALFAAFDVVFTRISYDLGRAAARQMQGEDI